MTFEHYKEITLIDLREQVLIYPMFSAISEYDIAVQYVAMEEHQKRGHVVPLKDVTDSKIIEYIGFCPSKDKVFWNSGTNVRKDKH